MRDTKILEVLVHADVITEEELSMLRLAFDLGKRLGVGKGGDSSAHVCRQMQRSLVQRLESMIVERPAHSHDHTRNRVIGECGAEIMAFNVESFVREQTVPQHREGP